MANFDGTGSQRVNTESLKPTYTGVSSVFGVASGAQDVSCFYGSPTKVIRLLQVGFSAVSSSGAGHTDILLYKRSSGNSAVSGLGVTNWSGCPHDPTDPGPTVSSYHLGSGQFFTSGTGAGQLIGRKTLFVANTFNFGTADAFEFPLSGLASVQPAEFLVFDFTKAGMKQPVLRNQHQGVCINLAGATFISGRFDLYPIWSWTEEPQGT